MEIKENEENNINSCKKIQKRLTQIGIIRNPSEIIKI